MSLRSKLFWSRENEKENAHTGSNTHVWECTDIDIQDDCGRCKPSTGSYVYACMWVECSTFQNATQCPPRGRCVTNDFNQTAYNKTPQYWQNVMQCAEKCDHVETTAWCDNGEEKTYAELPREEAHIDRMTWIGIGLGSFFAITALIVLSSYLIYKHIMRRRHRQYHAIQ
ncbi:hypothetical protein PROFUN_07024 [Planoprotostelium fungivorum]|uniref:Uncharacterized protein n=1 Tax=Planoprotostelium fungivorum TaxID=1890364 RepID=A0A2P6NMQ9_9EUKA|nr:hypothetical protein PROFUN_07024 [Planoprotostelium fungivorum]